MENNIITLNKVQSLEINYTIQTRGEKNEENLWNTVAGFKWCTTDLDEARAMAAEGEHIVWMLTTLESWDDLGDVHLCGYVETID